MTEELTAEPDPALLGIGITANIVQVTVQGHDGLEVRRGTKHFTPGAKVWVVPPHWDWHDRLYVVGRHRGRFNRYIAVVMRRDFLENPRVKGVYSPALARALAEVVGRPFWDSAEDAQLMLDRW
ncbi:MULTISPECIES: hypothetical protein [unclassified Kitasatospora]|uniref:hypothetical protein n=1 Tax=unclassified Kitasatospora TaxID=2633591 RepID=UPI00070C0381|nr:MULTISPECIES: hypothetical protein [unclassified Kitasatospora]KQV14557.1 hypothetical protein ASC99_30825 [Kitasatospora sp. Root107]KRB68096.1 hypothetical protein ASE03_29545 [Kitasatospora sp. Root187]